MPKTRGRPPRTDTPASRAVYVRMTDAELATAKAAAQESGLKFSEWARWAFEVGAAMTEFFFDDRRDQ